MDVKSALLNVSISELVFVKQSPMFHNHVYKIDKALYELKQASCVCYEHSMNLNKLHVCAMST
jgi:hypothetical protein